MIETLAAEIARLNTLAVPEHTIPAVQQSASVPAGGDFSAEDLKNSNDETLEEATQQQQQQIDV